MFRVNRNIKMLQEKCPTFSNPAFSLPATAIFYGVSKNQNAAKRASSLEHGWYCADVHCTQDMTVVVVVSGHLLARWRPAAIAMAAAELAAILMASASVDVTGASDSASTVIDSGPVDSMMLPSAVSDPISSSCHTVYTHTNSLAHSTAILHLLLTINTKKQPMGCQAQLAGTLVGMGKFFEGRRKCPRSIFGGGNCP